MKQTTTPTASASRHTPEPWLAILSAGPSDWLVAGGEMPIARIESYHGADACVANAGRIVACVNACAGMADPAAEIAATEGVMRSALSVVSDQKREIAALREALAATISALDSFPGMDDDIELIPRYEMRNARAALAGNGGAK